MGALVIILLPLVIITIFITITIMTRREDDAVITIYVLWLHLIFVTIIPVALLVWLNRIIYRKLSEAIILMMMMIPITPLVWSCLILKHQYIGGAISQ